RNGLACLAHAQGKKLLAMLLEQVGGAIEQLCATIAAELVPFDLRGEPGADHPVDIGFTRISDAADDDRCVERGIDWQFRALAAAGWSRGPMLAGQLCQLLHQRHAL